MGKEIIYNKLVRDLIPEVINKSNKSFKVHIADDKEYKEELLKKLSEETSEFIESPCEEEIADILEVIDGLISYYGFSKESIMKKKASKAKIRGKFNERIILESVIDDE